MEEGNYADWDDDEAEKGEDVIVDCALKEEIATAEGKDEEHKRDVDAHCDRELIVTANVFAAPARAPLLIEETHIHPVAALMRIGSAKEST